MSTDIANQEWTKNQKILFRFVFIYFVLQVVPLDWKYYAHFFSIEWSSLHFKDLFYISRYTPQPIQNYRPDYWGLSTLGEWLVIALLAVLGTVAWTLIEKKRLNYPLLYYWLRTLVRYRLAIGILAYGFIKLFPLQAPYPSISNLNTAYGDFNRWKLFAMSLGIVPGYESFLGFFEVAAGLLLMFRKTATFGTFIIVLFTGNVFMSNLAYEGGEGIYSLYLITLALLVLSYDAARLYQLLVLREPTQPTYVKPVFQNKWINKGLLGFKALAIFFFVFLYGAKAYATYRQGGYHYPKTKGLADAAGIYDVTDFKVNNEEHPYSDTDSTRWQNVVFEKWATISIKTLKPKLVDTLLSEEIYTDDYHQDYESAGSGERSYYTYTIDSAKGELHLLNKNLHYPNDKLTLHYSRPDSSHIVLSGLVSGGDSVSVVLNKINKKYLLKEAAQGRSKALKL